MGQTTNPPKLLLPYRDERDTRLKCIRCQEWMRYGPTPKTPLTRREAPHAHLCRLCPVPSKTAEQVLEHLKRLRHWISTHPGGTDTELRRLASLYSQTAALAVEGDNTQALALLAKERLSPVDTFKILKGG